MRKNKMLTVFAVLVFGFLILPLIIIAIYRLRQGQCHNFSN